MCFPQYANFWSGFLIHRGLIVMKTIKEKKMWIGRDLAGLYLFEDKPIKVDGLFISGANYLEIKIPDDMFPEIKLEDKESKRVNIKIQLLDE